MEEEVTEYVKVIKNDPKKRDDQTYDYIQEVITIHDDTFENGMNQYNIGIKTVLLSYFERLAYYDSSRASYQTYARYAEFLQIKAKRETDYNASAEKEEKEDFKATKGIISVLSNICKEISDPQFRVYLILLGVSVFKDEGTITKKQRELLDEIFLKLQIAD